MIFLITLSDYLESQKLFHQEVNENQIYKTCARSGFQESKLRKCQIASLIILQLLKHFYDAFLEEKGPILCQTKTWYCLVT